MLQDLDDRQLQVMMESFEIIQQRLLLMGASARDE